MSPRCCDARLRGMFPRRPGRPPAPAECFPVPRIWVTAPTGKHSHNVSPLLAQQRRGNIPRQPRRGNILSRSGRRGNIPAPGHSTRATGKHSWKNGRGCCPGGLVGGPGGNVSPSDGFRRNVSTTSRQADGETLCVPSTGKHSGNRADGETYCWLVKCFPVAGIVLRAAGDAVALLLLLLLLLAHGCKNMLSFTFGPPQSEKNDLKKVDAFCTSQPPATAIPLFFSLFHFFFTFQPPGQHPNGLAWPGPALPCLTPAAWPGQPGLPQPGPALCL